MGTYSLDHVSMREKSKSRVKFLAFVTLVPTALALCTVVSTVVGTFSHVTFLSRIRRSKYSTWRARRTVRNVYDEVISEKKLKQRSAIVCLSRAQSEPIHLNYILYEKEPSIQPLLILHGSFSSSLPFLDMAAALSESFSVYVLDLPGWGISSNIDVKNRTFDECIKLYIELLEIFLLESIELQKKNKKVTIIAHSVSAYFAIHFAHKNPDLVDRMILLSPAGIFPLLGESGAYWAFLFKTSIHQRVIRGISLFLLPIFHLITKNKFTLFSVSLLSLNLPCTDLLPKFIGMNWTNAHWKYPCLDKLISLKVPITFIYGTKDGLMPMHQGCAISILSDGRIKCFGVKDAWHAPHSKLPIFLVVFKSAVASCKVTPYDVISQEKHLVTFSNESVNKFRAYWSIKLSKSQIEKMYKELLVDKWFSMEHLLNEATIFK